VPQKHDLVLKLMICILFTECLCLHGHLGRGGGVRELGLGDHRWPVVTCFLGCKPCGILRIHSGQALEADRAFSCRTIKFLISDLWGHA